MDHSKKHLGILLLLFFGFAALYVTNISGWLMHDDVKGLTFTRCGSCNGASNRELTSLPNNNPSSC